MKDYRPWHFKKRRLTSLDTEDKINIINSVKVDKQTFLEAARIHKVNLCTVRYLMHSVENNKDYIEELLVIDSQKQDIQDKVVNIVNDLLKQRAVIENTNTIRLQLDKHTNQ